MLEDGGLVLCESGAIVTYLAETYGNGRLIPAGGAERAKYFEWVSFISMELDATALYVLRRHEALPEVYARVVQEFLAAIWPRREWSYEGIKRISCLWVASAALALIWSGVPFDTLIQIASFLLANLAIFLISLGALYLNRLLPRPHRTHWLIAAGGWLSAAVLGAFAAISAWGLAAKFGLL